MISYHNMRVVIQRVRAASVDVNDQNISEIGQGLMVLLGVAKGDSPDDGKYLVEKISNLRIFEDEGGKMNLSVQDIKGEILVVSQFTLYGDARKGRRPDFTSAANGPEANKLYEDFVSQLKDKEISVKTGKFQEHMLVDIKNDGTVTILLDSKKAFDEKL